MLQRVSSDRNDARQEIAKLTEVISTASKHSEYAIANSHASVMAIVAPVNGLAETSRMHGLAKGMFQWHLKTIALLL
jgi:hypothetical protein